MSRFFLFVILSVLCVFPAEASVEIALRGEPPTVLDEVYLRDGVSYLAIDDLLPLLGLTGSWDSVEHLYRIRYYGGRATISPGSQFLRIGDDFVPLKDRPRFIDGRLRVSEDFILRQLSSLVTTPIYYRNLNPQQTVQDDEESTLDRLFSFLLRRKAPVSGTVGLRGIAIDPGHGGQDSGSIGIGGVKEKDVSLGVSKRLEKLIKMRMGVPVRLTRDADYALTTQKRFETLAQQENDILLLLHAQSSFSETAQGVTLFVRPADEADDGQMADGSGSEQLARSLERAFKKAGFAINEVMRAPLLPLGRGNLPTVLVELGYLSNPGEVNRLNTPEGLDAFAEALFAGVKDYSDNQKGVSR